MGILYSAELFGTINTVRDLVELIAPSDAVVTVYRIGVFQTAEKYPQRFQLTLKMASGAYNTGNGSTFTANPQIPGWIPCH